MLKLISISVLFSCLAFTYSGHTTHMFVVLKQIKACEGKCNNYELKEYPKNSAEACKIEEDSARAKYGNQATYYTAGPGEALIYYKYNQFVSYCDCKIQGVHKSASVAKAKEEMQAKVDSARAKKPKAYHNYEITGSWPK